MQQIMIPSPRGTTRLLAILGDPVEQVQAPTLMNRLISESRADAIMVPIHVVPEALSSVMEGLKDIGNLDGMLVTVPHKFAVCQHIDRMSTAVELAGAANALRRADDGAWIGENFDGLGFVAGLRKAGYEPSRAVIALVGTGGAGSAIAAALVESGVKHLVVSDLASEKARRVAARLNEVHPGTVEVVSDAAEHAADIVVNCTPLGLRPDDPLPFEVQTLPGKTIVADIIMKPATTPLLAAARRRGLRTHPGIHMLTPQISLYARFFGIPYAHTHSEATGHDHG